MEERRSSSLFVLEFEILELSSCHNGKGEKEGWQINLIYLEKDFS